MWKKLLFATLAVFITWAVIDFIVNNLLLGGIYQETKDMWRPMEEMKWTTYYIQSILTALFFAWLWTKLISPKNMMNSVLFGLFWGLTHGLSMGYGSYSWMPIPYTLAISWFLTCTVQGVIGGVITGLIVKE